MKSLELLRLVFGAAFAWGMVDGFSIRGHVVKVNILSLNSLDRWRSYSLFGLLIS